MSPVVDCPPPAVEAEDPPAVVVTVGAQEQADDAVSLDTVLDVSLL